MASIIPEDVIEESFLHCLLCYSSFACPKLLPCLHSFCLKCLRGYVEKTARGRHFKCPECCVLLMVPEKGVEAFKTNSFITSLQDIVQSQSCSQKLCDNCPCNPEAALSHCLDCKLSLCAVCKNAHHWLKVTKGHRVVSLGELQSGRCQGELQKRQTVQCESHPDRAIHAVCLPCDRAVCPDCQLSSHNGHRLGDLSQAASRDRSLIQSLTESVVEQGKMFHNSLNDINDYLTACSTERDSILERLEEHRKHLHLMLDACHAELAKQVEDIYAEEIANKALKRREIQAIMSAMDHQKDFTSKLLRHGNDQNIITMSKILKVSLNNYSFLQPPGVDTKLQMLYSTPDVDTGRLLPMFGRIVKKQTSIAKCNSNRNEEGSYRAQHVPTLVRTISAKTEQDAKGCKPTAVAIGNNDEIIIVDDINKKLKVFDAEGNFKREIFPQGDGRLVDPWDVAVTKDGDYAVTDKGAHEVKVFSAGGQLVASFGEHLRCPWGVAVNSQGHIIVTDPAAQSIFIHEGPSGSLLFSIQCSHHSSTFLCPEYVTTNCHDDIIISDFDRHCIMAFDRQGRFLFRYGTRGNSIHEFNVPCGLDTDSRGNLFVADYSNSRLHLVTSDGQFKCFPLTREDCIQNPQDVAVSSKGDLVVVDDTNIKIFSYPQNVDFTKRRIPYPQRKSLHFEGIRLQQPKGPTESDI